jgi:hypothetical protein
VNAIEQPTGIGEIADRAITIVVRNWLALALVSLVASLPEAILEVVLPGVHASHTVPILFIGIVSALVAIPATLAVVSGRALTAIAALRFGVGKLWPTVRVYVVVTVILALFFIAIGLLFFLVVVIALVASHGTPSGSPTVVIITAGVVAIPALIWMPPILLCASVLHPMVILDGWGAWAAFGACWKRLVRGRFWSGWLVGIAFLAFTAVPSGIIGYLASAIAQDSASMNWAYALAKILTTPIQYSLDLALAYVIWDSLRAAQSGSDLEAAIDAPATLS